MCVCRRQYAAASRAQYLRLYICLDIYRGAITLNSAGFQSEVAIAQARATLETAKANLKRAQLDIGHLNVVAPFDGIIETRALDIGDYVVPGTICALLVDLDQIKVTALVNEHEVSKVKVRSVASASIGLNGPVEAVVSYIAHQANHMTQSYRLPTTCRLYVGGHLPYNAFADQSIPTHKQARYRPR